MGSGLRVVSSNSDVMGEMGARTGLDLRRLWAVVTQESGHGLLGDSQVDFQAAFLQLICCYRA